MNHNGRRWLITALLALMMVMMTSAALAVTGTVSVDSLVLREEMSTQSDALQTLPRGQEIEIIHQEGSWYKVKYGRYTGYVMSRYVKASGEVPSAEEVETLRLNDRGSEVKAMQKRLKELGYLTGTADGVFGAKTEAAVKAFQKRNGLTADGVAGPTTLKALNSTSAKPAESTDSSAGNTTAPEADDTLREGSRGEAVKRLQQRLKDLGYYTGSVDGVYGSGTIKAVRAFQNRNKLTVDGVAGSGTQKVLYSSSAKKAEDEKEPEQTQPTDEYAELRSGSRGDAVKKLQTRLKALGYYSGSIDGVYGTGTIKAIRAFQERNKLTVDGVAGSSTQKALYSSSAKKATDDEEEKDDKDDTATDDGTLREGSRGQAVKLLQEKLKKLGYYKGSIDGVYGSGTIAAVRAFQQRNRLTVDGVAGTDTLKVLYSTSAKDAEDEDDEVSEDLRAGAYGPEVRTLQKRLKELGYYTGSIDGSYGSQTATAVKAFQKRNGLTVDGVAGGKTLTVLNSSSAKAAEEEKVEEDKKEETEEKDDGVLRPGDSGDAVKDLQYRLRELGYYSASRDGVYGSATRTAVMAFQTRNGLTVDGIAGPATLKKLNSSSAVSAGSSSGSSNSGSSGSSGSIGTTDTTLKTNQTLKPGDSGAQVTAMQKRLSELGYYTNTLDGEYGYGTRQAVLAFQRNNGLTQDGIAGESTLKKMVSSDAVTAGAASSSKYITERLDWFNGGASRIPRGAIFQVKDVRTGYVFTAKRQGGGYHLDAEPLTAADTAILLKINGGVEFSYRRRPMLVLYNGRVYACSIYSEPHGDDTIASNNFDGQFCLHFYGSKTHGTDRVDEDHQKCEAQALQATW